jgi:hypothetical protein
MPEQDDGVLDLTPVDFAARAIVHLPLQPDAQGGAYHLLNPQPLRWVDVPKRLQAHGLAVRVVPADQWLALVRRDTGPGGLVPLLPW